MFRACDRNELFELCLHELDPVRLGHDVGDVLAPGQSRFDEGEARSRQGDDRERTISLGTIDGKEIPLTLVRIPASEFVMGDDAGADEVAS